MKQDEQKNYNSNRNQNVSIPSIGNRGRGGFGGGRGMNPVVKPKNFKATIARLWKYFGMERKLLSIIFGFIIVDAIIGLFIPYFIGKSVDAMSKGVSAVNFGLLKVMIALLILAYLSDAIITFLQGWLMSGVAQRIVMSMRRTLSEKLQKLPIAFFDIHTHGEIMSRFTNDIDNVSSTISQSTLQLLSGVITLSGSLIMMLILSPLLTLASIITVPLVFLMTRTIATKTKPLFKNQQVELGKMNGHIEETISGLMIVKAFNQEESVVNSFEKINEALCEVGLKAQIWSGFIMPLMNVINNLGFAAVAGAGGVMAVKNMVSVGLIASFLSYSRQFGRPLNDLANIFNNLQSAVAGAERVFEILDETEETYDTDEARSITKLQGDVTFEKVYFNYREDVKVLSDINFNVRAGDSIALVGPTGAGKTTIVNLLARFYDVTSGRILIDGIDIRDYRRSELRKVFGIVLQDTYLFSGTIKENIKYGRLDATDEEIIEAARMANADLFIKKLPLGYDTVLSESGGNLSEGQRQLLAISRAILKNPSILILDEATSNVDTRTELHIQEAMLKLMEGRTSFIIAHRLSTIREANTIMVVDHGQILECGSHDELLRLNGIYGNMYYSQFKNLNMD